MSILCRLGLHSWKPVWRRERVFSTRTGAIYWARVQTACQCRRCGKRVAL